MYCPSCGTQNADTNKFCLSCGSKLPGQNASTPDPAPIFESFNVHPSDPVSQAVTTGGISSIAGGGLSLLGWFVPWFSLGGLASWLMSFLGLGSGFGPLRFGAGIGNGLQIGLLALTAGFASFNSEEGIVILFGLFSLAFAGVIISIPIMAVANIRSGFRTFEANTSGDSDGAPSRSQVIRTHLENVRSRSIPIFVILAIIFLILAAVPFGTAVLGSGFYLTVLGTLVSFFGAFFAKSKIKV
jgi:hypothetical protein